MSFAAGVLLAGMFGRRLWSRAREAPAPQVRPSPLGEASAVPAHGRDARLPEPAGEPLAFPRPRPGLRHEWLDVTVARATLVGPLPLAHARVVVRAWPRGEPRPLEVVARALADAEGRTSFHLPVGRYAITATREGASRTVAVTVEHAGHATLLLDEAPRVRALTVEVVDARGRPLAGLGVEAAPARAGEGPACGGVTDERGRACLTLAPGAYEVRVAGHRKRTHVHRDGRVRVRIPEDDPAAWTARRLRDAVAAARRYRRPDAPPPN